MTQPRNPIKSAPSRLLTLVLASAAYLFPSALQAQTETTPPPQSQPATPAPSKPTIPRNLILIDPAHGGPDTGAHLSDKLFEKDVTLAFAARLRTLLAGSNFAVISTHETDPTTVFTTDQRAEVANHAHPTACILIHATVSGFGVHLFTSALTPPDSSDDPHSILPWDTAQAASILQSLRLANQLGVALLNAKLPVILTRGSAPPLDNLTCPAVAIELAPLSNEDADPTPVTDAAYQQRVAGAIVAGLSAWRSQNNTTGAAR